MKYLFIGILKLIVLVLLSIPIFIWLFFRIFHIWGGGQTKLYKIEKKIHKFYN